MRAAPRNLTEALDIVDVLASAARVPAQMFGASSDEGFLLTSAVASGLARASDDATRLAAFTEGANESLVPLAEAAVGVQWIADDVAGRWGHLSEVAGRLVDEARHARSLIGEEPSRFSRLSHEVRTGMDAMYGGVHPHDGSFSRSQFKLGGHQVETGRALRDTGLIDEPFATAIQAQSASALRGVRHEDRLDRSLTAAWLMFDSPRSG